MSNTKRSWAWIGAAIVFCVVLYATSPMTSWSARLKYPAPAFTLLDTNKQKISLNDFKGKKVILVFWESYCAVCIEHLKQFNAEYRHIDHSKLEILGITAENRSIDEIRRTTEKYGIKFPILKADLEILRTYKIYYLPTIFLIDEEGDITHVYSGDAAVENILRDIKGLYKK